MSNLDNFVILKHVAAGFVEQVSFQVWRQFVAFSYDFQVLLLFLSMNHLLDVIIFEELFGIQAFIVRSG